MKNKGETLTAGEGKWYIRGQAQGQRDENARCTKIYRRDTTFIALISMVYGMLVATVVIMMSLYL